MGSSSRTHIEHDFLGMQIQPSSQSPPRPRPRPRLDRRQSFRGISKINPEIVKSVLASSASTPQTHTLSNLPIFQPNPFSRNNDNEESSKENGDEEETAPMTIFYKGTVSVVDLPKEQAEGIIKYVMEKSSSMNNTNRVEQPSSNPETHNILHTFDDGDLSIKRNKSLHKFFERRKERLISVYPYQVGNVHQKSFT